MHDFYSDLALFFAQTGIDTVALDPYGRSAGLSARDDDFEFMPHADNAAFVRSLKAADKVHDYVVYEGAPHSFLDRGFEQWQAECTDAWIRMLGFIDRNR